MYIYIYVYIYVYIFMYTYGRGHYWFDYIFLRSGTIIFQVPPGNYQGEPQNFNFHWPPLVFLTVPICAFADSRLKLENI